MSNLILPKERHIYPNKKQFLFLNSTTRHTAYGGARGGGKSWVIREKAIMDATTYGRPNEWSPGIRICLLRRTLVDLTKNHLEPLKILTKGLAKYNGNDKCFYFDNGAIIQFAYCDCDNDADHFQGIEYDEIFIEEATQLKEEWIKKIAASCRGVNDYPHRVFYTCNPGGPGHQYIKRLFVDRIFKELENPEDYSFIQAKVTDNTVLQKYSPEYISFLQNLPPKIRESWLEGSWDIYSGQFFDCWRNDPSHYDDRLWTHVINPFKPRPSWPVYRSLDWGKFRPFSVGWWVVSEDDVAYRIMELYGVQKSAGESIPDQGVGWTSDYLFSQIARIENDHPWLAGKKIRGVADPAIFKSDDGPPIAENGYKYGIYFKPGDNHRIAGWDQVRYRMQFNDYGQPRLQIFRNCKDTIRTLPLLEHDEHIVEDCNTKQEDHAADEIRYFCQARPCKPLVPEPEYNPLYGIDPLHQFEGRRA